MALINARCIITIAQCYQSSWVIHSNCYLYPWIRNSAVPAIRKSPTRIGVTTGSTSDIYTYICRVLKNSILWDNVKEDSRPREKGSFRKVLNSGKVSFRDRASDWKCFSFYYIYKTAPVCQTFAIFFSLLTHSWHPKKIENKSRIILYINNMYISLKSTQFIYDIV